MTSASEVLFMAKALYRGATMKQYDRESAENLGTLLTRQAERRGDAPALTCEGETISWREFETRANRVAQHLSGHLGLGKGDAVAMMLENRIAFLTTLFGICKLGAVAGLLNTNQRGSVLLHSLNTIDAKALLVGEECLSAIVEIEGDLPMDPGARLVVPDRGEATLPSWARPFDDRDDTLPDGVPEAQATVLQKDPCFFVFTSGTTGAPKATMHFHRDLLIIADGYAREVLGVVPEDVFVGSPPLAFTFGLGGLAVFPLRFGAAATLLENASPPNMIEIIQKYRATVCFTAPTAYRAMLTAMEQGANLSSLRAAVSAGETLPAPVYQEWMAKTGKPMLDGIGATELLHIFISNRFDDHRPACTGKPVCGYEAKVIGEDGAEVARGTVGRLAVRGPTGCRYLADQRQADYVQDGWNVTGDAFVMDEDGYLHFAARNDDMIISSGYNIAGPEVEAALLSHPHVAECAVIGVPDAERGAIVQAHVVLRDGVAAADSTGKALQDHVKSRIAPYKYPRSIVFCDGLPKTESGKIQRFRLRQARP